jgi:internalin A
LPTEIAELKNLTVLYLSRNQLTSLPTEIAELKNLTVLYLFHNQLTSLPTEIVELKNLTVLYLSRNQLTSLPTEIVELKNLTTLGLSGNPLEFPPMDIANRGIEAIRSYFKSVEGERRALNEVKVLLVGDGGAGKTSLVKQVLGEDFDTHEPQTHGIHLRDWTSDRYTCPLLGFRRSGDYARHASVLLIKTEPLHSCFGWQER